MRFTKLRNWASMVPEELRAEFVRDCEAADKSWQTMADLACTRGEFGVPLSRSEDEVRIRIIVYGTPTGDDWRRVQAFCAIARGEFEETP